MTNDQTYASAQLAVQVLEAASRLNAAVWTGYASVQTAAMAARTPGPWSAPGAVLGTISAGASFAYAGVEIANIAALLSSGVEIDAATTEKINIALDMLESPMATAIEAAELLLTGSAIGSRTYAVLDAAKQALDTFRTSENVTEKLAAYEKLKEALEDLVAFPQKNPSLLPVEDPEEIREGLRDPLDLLPSEFGPMAGEPYKDPGVAYV